MRGAPAMTERFFAPCPRGLESALAVELGTLDAAFVVPADGGVAFSGPLELAYRANLESRLASRILWQVAHGAYRDEDALYRLAHGIDWSRERLRRIPIRYGRFHLRSARYTDRRNTSLLFKILYLFHIYS